MPTWNEAFVHGLVTDAGSLRDGEKLAAKPAVWSRLGCTDQAAWGLAQGSGKTPYQVSADLSDGATKCTCPSRKFPCKHGVGLLLLLVRGALPTADPPDWVIAWLEGRTRRREAAPRPIKAPDTAEQVKREAARRAKVAAGVEELRLFLEDLVRRGLSDPEVKTYAFWDRIAARMVDAQMQPVARRLRALGGLPFQKRTDWAGTMLEAAARLYTLSAAYQQIDTLPDGLAHDVRAAIGFTLKQETVLETGTPITDRWQIVGGLTETVEQVQERRTWLYGETTRRYALLLDYAHRSQPFTPHYPLGQAFTGTLVYYPSAYPQRAILKERHSRCMPIMPEAVQFAADSAAVLDAYADALALNPFLELFPAGLQRSWVNSHALIDASGSKLPLLPTVQEHWRNTVLGGDWRPVFGEWDGATLHIASVVTPDVWVRPR